MIRRQVHTLRSDQPRPLLAAALLLISPPAAAQKVNLRTQTQSMCAAVTLYFAGATGQVDCEGVVRLVHAPWYAPAINPFSVGAATPNYAFHFEYGSAPAYGGWHTGAMFGRKHSVNFGGAGSSQNAVAIVHEGYYDMSTPWAGVFDGRAARLFRQGPEELTVLAEGDAGRLATNRKSAASNGARKGISCTVQVYSTNKQQNNLFLFCGLYLRLQS